MDETNFCSSPSPTSGSKKEHRWYFVKKRQCCKIETKYTRPKPEMGVIVSEQYLCQFCRLLIRIAFVQNLKNDSSKLTSYREFKIRGQTVSIKIRWLSSSSRALLSANSTVFTFGKLGVKKN